jgi:hypothetical protein
MTELRSLQKEHGGEIMIRKKRDGQNWGNPTYWPSDSLLGMRLDDSDTVIRYRPSDDIAALARDHVIGGNQSITAALFEMHPDEADIEQVRDILTIRSSFLCSLLRSRWEQQIKEIIEQVDDENLSYDIWMDNPNPGHVNFTISEESTSYRDDVYTTELVLVTTKTFYIQDREAGNKIDAFSTLSEAQKALAMYEEDDKAEGTYTPNFYEIVEE